MCPVQHLTDERQRGIAVSGAWGGVRRVASADACPWANPRDAGAGKSAVRERDDLAQDEAALRVQKLSAAEVPGAALCRQDADRSGARSYDALASLVASERQVWALQAASCLRQAAQLARSKTLELSFQPQRAA